MCVSVGECVMGVCGGGREKRGRGRGGRKSFSDESRLKEAAAEKN